MVELLITVALAVTLGVLISQTLVRGTAFTQATLRSADVENEQRIATETAQRYLASARPLGTCVSNPGAEPSECKRIGVSGPSFHYVSADRVVFSAYTEALPTDPTKLEAYLNRPPDVIELTTVDLAGVGSCDPAKRGLRMRIYELGGTYTTPGDPLALVNSGDLTKLKKLNGVAIDTVIARLSAVAGVQTFRFYAADRSELSVVDPASVNRSAIALVSVDLVRIIPYGALTRAGASCLDGDQSRASVTVAVPSAVFGNDPSTVGRV